MLELVTSTAPSEVEPSVMEQASKETSDPSAIPPEGGLQGWLCVMGSFACIFSTFGFLNAIGVFQTTYETTYLREFSPSDISWIFAVQLALMWAPGPFFGRIVDTFGPAPVLYPCSLLCVFSLCMTSLSTKYYQIFLSQGIGFGIGCGGIFTTALICVGQWFQARRGLAIGIATVGSSLGGVIFPIFLHRVTDLVGFAGAVRYTALLIGILLALSCFLIKARLPRKKWNPDLKWFDITLFKDRAFLLYTLGSYFVMWGLWAPFDYLSSMAAQSGFSTTMALYLISVVNATSIPGRIVPAYLSDHIGHFNVICVSALLTGIAIISLWLPFDYHHSHAGLIVFALVYGFVSGAYVSLMMPCAAKSGTLETLGVRFGTYQSIVAVSCLTGLPIQGAILSKEHGSFLGLQLFAGVSVFIGTVLIVGARFVLAGTNKTGRV